MKLMQQVPQREKISSVERIKGYRYPAPGSITGARVPNREREDDIYDTKHFSRDPRNLQKDVSNSII